MKRRSYLKAMLAATAGLSDAGAQAPKRLAQNPIVLHVDLSVDPAKEQEMLHNFHTIFKPAATKFPGYVDVKMCKLRSAIQGAPPSNVNYRFQLTYQSEELRQKWVASETHQKVWPTIENTLKSKNYVVLLFDSVYYLAARRNLLTATPAHSAEHRLRNAILGKRQRSTRVTKCRLC